MPQFGPRSEARLRISVKGLILVKRLVQKCFVSSFCVVKFYCVSVLNWIHIKSFLTRLCLSEARNGGFFC